MGYVDPTNTILYDENNNYPGDVMDISAEIKYTDTPATFSSEDKVPARTPASNYGRAAFEQRGAVDVGVDKISVRSP